MNLSIRQIAPESKLCHELCLDVLTDVLAARLFEILEQEHALEERERQLNMCSTVYLEALLASACTGRRPGGVTVASDGPARRARRCRSAARGPGLAWATRRSAREIRSGREPRRGGFIPARLSLERRSHHHRLLAWRSGGAG